MMMGLVISHINCRMFLMQTDKADPFPVMEPIQNDSVPWSNFKLAENKISLAFSGLFILTILIPVGLIFRYRS